MCRFLLLYFGIIIITICGINCNFTERFYLPCSRCVKDHKYTHHNELQRVKQFCEACIPNSTDINLSTKLRMWEEHTGKDINPCNDFYEYVCGAWDNANSKFQTNWSVISQLQHKTYYALRVTMENRNKHDHLPFVKLAKQFYGSCINNDTLEERGLEPMQQMLDATGGWPILMSEKEENAKEITWQKMDNDYLQLYTFSILFNISYTINDGNSMLMVHPSLPLPLGDKLKIDVQNKKNDLQNKNYDIYISTIMEVVKAFIKDKGIQISELQLHTDIIDLVLFETSLLNLGYEKKIPTAGNKMTIEELQKFYDLTETQSTAKINWLDKIQIVSKFLGVTVKASETVLVYDKEILHKLKYLLNRTPQRVIVNYLQWHIVRTFMGNLNEQMRDIELKYYNTSNTEIYNRMKQERRWLKCIKESQMKDVLLYLCGKSLISADNIKAISDILEDLKDRMINYIYATDALELDMLTRRFIVGKIHSTSLKVSYFEWHDNGTALTEMYNGLKIDDNYFTNVLAIIKCRNIAKQKSFRESKHRDESLHRWSFDFLSGNPSYDQQTNVIYIPIALTLKPYFSLTEKRSIAANYGGLGSIIAQQLAHSLNMHIGSYLDEHQISKWNIRIRQIYEDHFECLMMSGGYYSFILDDDPINLDTFNGFQNYENCVRNESITYFLGTQIAFAAFQERKDLSTKPDVPNLSLEQVFFLYNTRIRCGTTNSYGKDFANINDAKVQTVRSLSNTKAFSEAFNCPKDSPMNPSYRCEIAKY